MNFQPDRSIWLPDGQHKRGSICLAFVGSPVVDIRWAVEGLEVQPVTNARVSISCTPHENLDTARNLAIHDWLRAPIEERTDWIALIAADSRIRPDAVVRAVLDDKPVNRVGETFILARSVLEVMHPPWFAGNTFQGPIPPHVRDDLGPDTEPATVDNAISPSFIPAEEAEKMVLTCIPTLGKTSLHWVAAASTIAPPIASTRMTIVARAEGEVMLARAALAKGYEVGQARQLLVEQALRMHHRPRYLFFFGDDMIAPSTGLRMLFDTMQATGNPAVAGLYYVKNAEPEVPLMWRNDALGVMKPGVDFQVGEAVEVHGTGLDFVLFETEALARVAAEHGELFRTRCDWIEGQGLMQETEDSFFWKRWIKTHGRGPIVDTRCRVGHFNVRDGQVY